MIATVLSSASGAAQAAPDNPGGTALALLVIIVAITAWLGLRAFVRSLRARKTESTVGANFVDYALEALVNAAKIDGRVNEQEQQAIATAMTELAGADFDVKRVEETFQRARLSKDELVAYLAARAGAFSREQKTMLLKALLAVFVADGRFHESEHAALVDYTAAVGFDRRSAPDMLRGLSRDFARGNIT